MTTWREAIYMVSDELKINSDDTYYNEEHILFLVNKYRSFILKQKYNDIKKHIPSVNYQTIIFKLENSISKTNNRLFLQSDIFIPQPLEIGSKKVYNDYYDGEITLVSKDRMKYVGENQYLQNFIYCSIDTDNRLKFVSLNPQFKHLKQAKMTCIFQDALDAWKYRVYDGVNDVIDSQIPVEDQFIPSIIQMVREELKQSVITKEDNVNDANDGRPVSQTQG